MVTVEEASSLIFSHLLSPQVTPVPLHDAVQGVLAAPVLADRDLPPFDRVSMDGIAINAETFRRGRRDFAVEGMAAAGEPRKSLQDIDRCIEVMTGAPLPEGTDAVVRYEDVTISGDHATILIADVPAGQHIHQQGADARKHARLLEPGMVLSPAEIALLASVGVTDVPVYAFPKTALISSGDELVGIQEAPEQHQIRRSNTYALEAAMERMKWKATQFHLPDRRDFLEDALRLIAADHDILILSGGVSKGKFDFIPEVMQAIGIHKHFHGVSQRPGKPFWFGTGANGKTVFALPGNPVSTYLCFYRYIKPWMERSMGVTPSPSFAILAEDYVFQPDLTYFLQVRVQNEKGRLMAYPHAGGGSGDFANLNQVQGFLELPRGRHTFQAGEAFPYLPFRH